MYAAKPEKDKYSHPADALQYIAYSLKNSPEAREAAQRVMASAGGAAGGGEWRVPPTQMDSAGLY
jgi:hypothetical protein